MAVDFPWKKAQGQQQKQPPSPCLKLSRTMPMHPFQDIYTWLIEFEKTWWFPLNSLVNLEQLHVLTKFSFHSNSAVIETLNLGAAFSTPCTKKGTQPRQPNMVKRGICEPSKSSSTRLPDLETPRNPTHLRHHRSSAI
jgi:hypothetical protein